MIIKHVLPQNELWAPTISLLLHQSPPRPILQTFSSVPDFTGDHEWLHCQLEIVSPGSRIDYLMDHCELEKNPLSTLIRKNPRRGHELGLNYCAAVFRMNPGR